MSRGNATIAETWAKYERRKEMLDRLVAEGKSEWEACEVIAKAENVGRKTIFTFFQENKVHPKEKKKYRNGTLSAADLAEWIQSMQNPDTGIADIVASGSALEHGQSSICRHYGARLDDATMDKWLAVDDLRKRCNKLPTAYAPMTTLFRDAGLLFDISGARDDLYGALAQDLLGEFSRVDRTLDFFERCGLELRHEDQMRRRPSPDVMRDKFDEYCALNEVARARRYLDLFFWQDLLRLASMLMANLSAGEEALEEYVEAGVASRGETRRFWHEEKIEFAKEQGGCIVEGCTHFQDRGHLGTAQFDHERNKRQGGKKATDRHGRRISPAHLNRAQFRKEKEDGLKPGGNRIALTCWHHHLIKHGVENYALALQRAADGVHGYSNYLSAQANLRALDVIKASSNALGNGKCSVPWCNRVLTEENAAIGHSGGFHLHHVAGLDGIAAHVPAEGGGTSLVMVVPKKKKAISAMIQSRGDGSGVTNFVNKVFPEMALCTKDLCADCHGCITILRRLPSNKHFEFRKSLRLSSGEVVENVFLFVGNLEESEKEMAAWLKSAEDAPVTGPGPQRGFEVAMSGDVEEEVIESEEIESDDEEEEEGVGVGGGSGGGTELSQDEIDALNARIDSMSHEAVQEYLEAECRKGSKLPEEVVDEVNAEVDGMTMEEVEKLLRGEE